MDTNMIEIKDNAFLRQYQYKHDLGMVKIEYAQQERKIFLTKLIIPEELQEDVEFREDFLKAVFADIRDNKKLKVVPTHPTIAGFVRKHRNDYKEMLPVGISI